MLTTISDKKFGVQNPSDTDHVKYYNAHIITASDYYPFGMKTDKNYYGAAYNSRYGFNGQEKSDEIAGDGNHYTAEFWEYDSRSGRRWNLDPSPVSGISAYSAFANNPNFFTDPFGDTSKFFGNSGMLRYQDNKGKGNNLYVVGDEQFNSLNSKYKNRDKLTSELIKIGIKAYANQDEAAGEWAPGGFTATKGDNNERAARIFKAKAFGDPSIAYLYVVGATIIGHKSSQLGVSQEVDPSGSRVILNGKDISSYETTNTETKTVKGIIVGLKVITYKNWQVSAMVHTHNDKHDNYSISNGSIINGENHGGDYGIAVDGISVYMIPTSGYSLYRMFRLDLSPNDRDMYFETTRDGEKYMNGLKTTYFLDDKGNIKSIFRDGNRVR